MGQSAAKHRFGTGMPSPTLFLSRGSAAGDRRRKKPTSGSGSRLWGWRCSVV